MQRGEQAPEAKEGFGLGRVLDDGRLVVVYQSPSQAATVGTQSVTVLPQNLWKNEPLQSWWTPQQMQAQLDRAGFRVASDRDLVELGAEFGADFSSAGQLVRDGRVVVTARR